MIKKIKTTDLDLTVRTSTAIIIQVGLIKFVKDEEYPWIDIFVTGGETDEFIEQEDTENASRVIDLEDLKIFAVNWVFENVEVVKEIKEETAQEVPVQEQSGKFTPEDSNGVCTNTKSIECPYDCSKN